MHPIVRQVDHIMILTRDPDSLYSFLVNLLELPVLHPYRPEAPGFKSGLLCAENVNLEVIPSSPTPARESPATFGNMAFEPNTLATSIAELKAREIEYSGPFPHVETDANGKQRTRWTNVGLRTLRGAFLCEYNFDVAGRRKTCQQELGGRGGGPIGLKSVKEIVLGVTELDDAIARWQKVLDPLRPATPGFWRVGDGPALRLIQSDRAGILRLVLEVKSLDQAGVFLARHNLLGSRSKDKIKLEAKAVQGLDLHLVEAAP
jgi:hypothetical protein